MCRLVRLLRRQKRLDMRDFRWRLAIICQNHVRPCQCGLGRSIAGLRNGEGDVVHDPEATHSRPAPDGQRRHNAARLRPCKTIRRRARADIEESAPDPSDIENADARLKVRDQIRFLNLVAVALQDDFLGFHLAQPADLREMGWLHYVVASSEMMSDALKRGARYSSIVNEGIALKYVENGDVTVTIDYVGVSRHLDRHQMEFLMTTLVRLCRQLTGLRLVPSRVRFTHHRESTSAGICGIFRHRRRIRRGGRRSRIRDRHQDHARRQRGSLSQQATDFIF